MVVASAGKLELAVVLHAGKVLAASAKAILQIKRAAYSGPCGVLSELEQVSSALHEFYWVFSVLRVVTLAAQKLEIVLVITPATRQRNYMVSVELLSQINPANYALATL